MAGRRVRHDRHLSQGGGACADGLGGVGNVLHRRTGGGFPSVQKRAAEGWLRLGCGDRLRAVRVKLPVAAAHQELLHYPAYQAGLVLMPRALTMLLAMPIVGRLYNLVSPRTMIGAGVVLLAYAYWRLGHFTLYVGFWS